MSHKIILFRTDGNANIGAGHIMRCLSIGMAAKQLGYYCIYVLADNSFRNIIETNGFEVNVLNTDYADLDNEIDDVVEIIKRIRPLVTFVDSYYVTEQYLYVLRENTILAYIDDVKAFPYPVDYLINYNAFAHNLNYPDYYKKHKVDSPVFLFGERYVPLRQEFQNQEVIKIKKGVHDILFSAGGADPERIALKFVQAVTNSKELNKYIFHIVLGSFEPDTKAIRALETQYSQLIIHERVTKMSDLMRQCDMAISAAGSTLYELCACGIPTITYILEDNQILGAQSLCEKNVMINAGDYRIKQDFFETLIEHIILLDHDYNKRKKMHELAIKSVDGYGATKILEKIIQNC